MGQLEGGPGNKDTDIEHECLLDAIVAYAGDGTIMPNFDGAILAADGLRECAKAECAPWWDPVHDGIKLAGLNLHGVSLSGADLTGASLGRSDLSTARAHAVKLQGAHLDQTRFDV